MENNKRELVKSLTAKGLVVAGLTLLLLIPAFMVEGLIEERQKRSKETRLKINEKWGLAQTICAPLVVVPYTKAKYVEHEKKAYNEEHRLYITPNRLKIEANLQPEERHYGIYKSILYRSNINFSGDFANINDVKVENGVLLFDKAFVVIGLTDLRGVAQNINFKTNGSNTEATVGNPSTVASTAASVVHYSNEIDNSTYEEDMEISQNIADKFFVVPVKLSNDLSFEFNIELKGSDRIQFIPIGQSSEISIAGNWDSPSFVGAFSPEYSLDKNRFDAKWNILSFNREIPKFWSDDSIFSLHSSAFGVELVERVNNYQKNMRSVKYAIMFIVLTFVSLFFVEIFAKVTVHFAQYLLTGLALILFYSLLLSISEQISFNLAYLISGIATVSLIGAYAYSVLRKPYPVIALIGILIGLYTFLFIILQLEDFALLFGSLFLFVILGVIMFVSSRIRCNKQK